MPISFYHFIWSIFTIFLFLSTSDFIILQTILTSILFSSSWFAFILFFSLLLFLLFPLHFPFPLFYFHFLLSFNHVFIFFFFIYLRPIFYCSIIISNYNFYWYYRMNTKINYMELKYIGRSNPAMSYMLNLFLFHFTPLYGYFFLQDLLKISKVNKEIDLG